jgi:tetratricopeptide (TPR) repeat protein
MKNLKEAEEKITSGLKIYQDRLPADHWNISYAESLLGKCYSRGDKYEQAEKLLLGAYKNLLEKRGKDDRLTISTIKMLIINYERWGEKDQAKKFVELLSPADVIQLDATATP